MKTKSKKTEDRDDARNQARAQVENIMAMVKELNAYHGSSEHAKSDEAVQTIQESPLSVQVRGAWRDPGADNDDVEFTILLCTGGPAVRIIGALDKYKQPENIRVEYQDWGTPWTDYHLMEDARKAVLTYAQQFYFGE